MNTIIKGTNIDLTEDIRSYAKKRLEKIVLLVDSGDEEAVVRIEIGRETKHHQKGDIFRCEIQLYFLGKNLRKVAMEEDARASIDSATDVIFKEVTSRRGKFSTSTRKGARKIKDILKRFQK